MQEQKNMSNSDQQIEELHGPNDIEIKIIDKDNNNQDFEPEIDYNNFDFEQYMHNASMKEMMERKKSGEGIETTLVKKKSEAKNKEVSQVNQDEVVIKGFLDRKVSKILKSWQKRYCLLTRKQLFCFESEARVNLISCVNLKLLPCSATLEGDCIFLYYCVKQPPVIFQLQSKELTQKWFDKIKQVIKFQQNAKKIFLKSANAQIYNQKNMFSEEQFLKEAQSGDILLMKTSADYCCSFQRMITNSEYDHMAMIMKFQNGDVKVFESNTAEGVQLYHWKEYMSKFNIYDQIALRKLYYDQKKELHQEFFNFAKSAIGGQYKIGAMKLMKLRSHAKDKEFNNDEKRTFFCSQLIAKVYKLVGLLDQEKASSRYWPTDFTQRGGLALLKQAYLGNQKTIVLTRHTKQIILKFN